MSHFGTMYYSGSRNRVGDLTDIVEAVSSIPSPNEIIQKAGEYVAQVASNAGEAVQKYAVEQYTTVMGAGVDPKTACESSGIGYVYMPGIGCVPQTLPVEVASRQMDCASRGMVYREYDANGNPVIAGCVPQGGSDAPSPENVIAKGVPVAAASPVTCIYKGANGKCWSVPCGGKFTTFDPSYENGGGGCGCIEGYEWVDPSPTSTNYDCKKKGGASTEGGKDKETSYWPWILGGAAVVIVGGTLLVMNKKKTKKAA